MRSQWLNPVLHYSDTPISLKYKAKKVQNWITLVDLDFDRHVRVLETLKMIYDDLEAEPLQQQSGGCSKDELDVKMLEK